MTFRSPEVLVLLVLVPAAAALFVYAARKRRQALALFLGGAVRSGAAAPGRAVRAGLQTLALAALVVALAGPRVGTAMQEARRGGLDLVVALDVSESMRAEDVAPSRLERARFVLTRLAEARPADRLALVAFAGDGAVLCPLTSDAAAFRLFLDAAGPEVVGVPGSDLARGLAVASAAFDPQDASRPRAVLLVTDGEDHEGGAAEAAAALRRTGVAVLALAVGTRDGAPIPVPGGGRKRDRNGDLVVSRLDPDALRTIADGEVTEIAGDPVAALDARLSRLAGVGRGVERVPAAAERYQWPLGLALLLLAAERVVALLGARRRRDGEVAPVVAPEPRTL